MEQCSITENSPITVTCRHHTLCITLYPRQYDTPILIQDGIKMYITSRRAISANLIDDDETMGTASANLALTTTASAFAIQ
jgi:hypothetical protein